MRRSPYPPEVIEHKLNCFARWILGLPSKAAAAEFLDRIQSLHGKAVRVDLIARMRAEVSAREVV